MTRSRVRIANHNLRSDSDLGVVLSHLLLVLILVTGSMPLLDVAVRPSSDGPAFSLDLCHPVQALDTAGGLIPLAIPTRVAYRSPSPAFTTPRPFQIHFITDYIPDINPPPPK
jgi:hypothetical protein